MPTKPTQDQIDNINELIQDALDDEADGDRKSAAKNKQRAIHLVDKYFNIGGNPYGEPKYDPTLKGQAESDAVDGRVKARIGDRAFVDKDDKPSAAWLASTKIHEILGHGAQIKPGNGWIHPGDYPEGEVEAYNKELEFKDITGISPEQIKVIKDNKRKEFSRMAKDRQEEWKKREPWLSAATGAGPKDGLFAERSDIEYVLGLFKLPSDIALVDAAGMSVAIAKGTSLAAAAGNLAHGELGTLLQCNPGLNMSLAALHALLSGPSSDDATEQAIVQTPSSVVLYLPQMIEGVASAAESEQSEESRFGNTARSK
jgi:hypothetical protein